MLIVRFANTINGHMQSRLLASCYACDDVINFYAAYKLQIVCLWGTLAGLLLPDPAPDHRVSSSLPLQYTACTSCMICGPSSIINGWVCSIAKSSSLIDN